MRIRDRRINVLYNVVDRMYIGNIPDIGATALTGVGVTFPVLMIVSAFAAFAGMGGAPRAGIRLGAGDKDGAEQILGNCFSLLLVLSVALTVVFQLLRTPILVAFGATGNLLPVSYTHLGAGSFLPLQAGVRRQGQQPLELGPLGLGHAGGHAAKTRLHLPLQGRVDPVSYTHLPHLRRPRLRAGKAGGGRGQSPGGLFRLHGGGHHPPGGRSLHRPLRGGAGGPLHRGGAGSDQRRRRAYPRGPAGHLSLIHI